MSHFDSHCSVHHMDTISHVGNDSRFDNLNDQIYQHLHTRIDGSVIPDGEPYPHSSQHIPDNVFGPILPGVPTPSFVVPVDTQCVSTFS